MRLTSAEVHLMISWQQEPHEIWATCSVSAGRSGQELRRASIMPGQCLSFLQSCAWERVEPSSVTYLPVSPCRSFRCESVLSSRAERRRCRQETEETQLLPQAERRSLVSISPVVKIETSGSKNFKIKFVLAGLHSWQGADEKYRAVAKIADVGLRPLRNFVSRIPVTREHCA